MSIEELEDVHTQGQGQNLVHLAETRIESREDGHTPDPDRHRRAETDTEMIEAGESGALLPTMIGMKLTNDGE